MANGKTDSYGTWGVVMSVTCASVSCAFVAGKEPWSRTGHPPSSWYAPRPSGMPTCRTAAQTRAPWERGPGEGTRCVSAPCSLHSSCRLLALRVATQKRVFQLPVDTVLADGWSTQYAGWHSHGRMASKKEQHTCTVCCAVPVG
jgi:hypothetical protein